MSEKRLLVTLATGAVGSALARISHPLMRDYADSIGADFIALLRENATHDSRTDVQATRFRKLMVGELFQAYDRILVLDGDILVRPEAPDVFSLVPDDHVGATRIDRLPPKHAPAIREGGVRDDIELIQKTFKDVGWEGPYYNSGVLVLSGPHRKMLDRCVEDAATWASQEGRTFNDQTLINYWIHRLGVPVHDLGGRYNHTPAFNWKRHRYRSYFVHYAGFRGHRRGNRYRQMQFDRWIYERPRIRKFIAEHPRLARCLDWAFPLPEKLIAPWRLLRPREDMPARYSV